MASADSSSKPAESLVNAYRSLPPIKGNRCRLTSSSPFTPAFIHSSLPSTSTPSTVYTSRVEGRQVVLENPAKESKAKKARDERKTRRAKDSARRKARIISKKEAKEKAVWEFDPKLAKYETFLPIHHLWLGYMSELLGLPPRPATGTSVPKPTMPNTTSMQTKLVKADFHGSIVSVRQSKNPSLVGCSGIVIHETENTFKVVTMKDELKVIPKQNSIFALSIPLYGPPLSPPVPEPTIDFELYGNQFRFRSIDRASRKFKSKETIEL